ncbi:MAG: hypothetical protein KGQ36_04780, partial [Rickettsiales bacterium]|nr:hypothetical protein [Rickettsiales bacterium]
KILIKIFLCISLLTLSSCTLTKILWGDKSYQETVSQFLIGADGRYVALIGTGYHYVFSDSSGTLKEVLALNQKGTLRIDTEATYLKLDSNNDIKGDLVISGPFDILPLEDKMRLNALGFKEDRNGNIKVKISLAGKRYLSKYLGHNAASTAGIPYIITIYYSGDSSIVKGVGKIAVTPIAVTLDAVLLIGKIVVAPVMH